MLNANFLQIGILEGVMGTLFDMPQLSHLKKPQLSGQDVLVSIPNVKL